MANAHINMDASVHANAKTSSVLLNSNRKVIMINAKVYTNNSTTIDISTNCNINTTIIVC